MSLLHIKGHRQYHQSICDSLQRQLCSLLSPLLVSGASPFVMIRNACWVFASLPKSIYRVLSTPLWKAIFWCNLSLCLNPPTPLNILLAVKTFGLQFNKAVADFLPVPQQLVQPFLLLQHLCMKGRRWPSWRKLNNFSMLLRLFSLDFLCPN